MSIPARYRGWLYVLGIVISVALGVLVALGVVTEDKVTEVIAVVLAVWAAITNALARLNLSADPEA